MSARRCLKPGISDSVIRRLGVERADFELRGEPGSVNDEMVRVQWLMVGRQFTAVRVKVFNLKSRISG